MKRPSTRYANNDEAAHAVYRYVQTHQLLQRHLTLRPYNYTAPKLTPWWLVPTTAWPAYHHSKLCFEKWDPETMIIGFYVEKGLGEQVAEMVKSSLIMESGWYWSEFLQAAQDGQFAEPMRHVLARSGLPLIVHLSLFEFNNVPDFETGERNPNDELAFLVASDNLSFGQYTTADGALSALNDARTLSELAAGLSGLEEMSWYWINLRIGVRVRYRTGEPGEWGAEEIWNRSLQPWVRWVW